MSAGVFFPGVQSDGVGGTTAQQLRNLKALRHLVKQHDLQLRECSNHLEPQLLEVLGDLDTLENEGRGTEELAQIEREAHELIERIESAVEVLCTEVESRRTAIDSETQEALRELDERLHVLLTSVKALHQIDAEITTAHEKQQQRKVERSKEVFKTDDTFKSLLEEKRRLCEEEVQLQGASKKLDTERIAILKVQLDDLRKEKSSLHQALLSCQHLDDVAAETLNDFLASTSPPPDVVKQLIENGESLKDNKENLAAVSAVSSASTALTLTSSESGHHSISLDSLFDIPPESLLGDAGPFSETEWEAIHAVVEQRKRERRVISSVAAYIAEHDTHEKITAGLTNSPKVTTNVLANVLTLKPRGVFYGAKALGTHDFDDLFQKPSQSPMTEVVSTDDGPIPMQDTMPCDADASNNILTNSNDSGASVPLPVPLKPEDLTNDNSNGAQIHPVSKPHKPTTRRFPPHKILMDV